MGDLSHSDSWHIVTDCRLTRRKYYHAVIGPDGTDRFRSRILWDCVEYLDAEGVSEYQLVAGALTGSEQVEALNVSKEV